MLVVVIFRGARFFASACQAASGQAVSLINEAGRRATLVSCEEFVIAWPLQQVPADSLRS